MRYLVLHDIESGCHAELTCEEPVEQEADDMFRWTFPDATTAHTVTIVTVDKRIGDDGEDYGPLRDTIADFDVGQELWILDIASDHPQLVLVSGDSVCEVEIGDVEADPHGWMDE